jgi:proteasome lid subunit RPN8/RPN11
MTLIIPEHILDQIHRHGEEAYPEEGAGLMLGTDRDDHRTVESLLLLDNAREEGARHNRYLLTAEDMLRGEREAEKLDLAIIGIFHSHPDHPNAPSEYDREWAVPWYSYLITSVEQGEARGSRAWRLKDDRAAFDPEDLEIRA